MIRSNQDPSGAAFPAGLVHSDLARFKEPEHADTGWVGPVSSDSDD